MKILFLLCILLFIAVPIASAQALLDSLENDYQPLLKEKLVLYKRNYDSPFLQASVNNLINLAKKSNTHFTLLASQDMEQEVAFKALIAGDIDIFIGSPNLARETLAPMIYVPLDRGLLGFRLCLVHENTAQFSGIRTQAQFNSKKLTVGLGTFWPDRSIFEDNGFTIIHSATHSELFELLINERVDCFSRSIIEIDKDLAQYSQQNIAIDTKLAFIYPNADFIFVNPHKPELLQILTQALNMAVDNNSYYELFDSFYASKLAKHQVFERKLIFLRNTGASSKSIEAINRYGIATFIVPK